MKIPNKMFLGSFLIFIILGWPCRINGEKQVPYSKVIYLSHQKLSVAFAKGKTLVKAQSGHATYEVIAAQREHPGEVEIHMLDTDIIYVVKGTATFITGGKVAGEKNVAPNELQGRLILDGTSHRLGPGDIIIVPRGVPHWFKEVRPPFLYLVVKVR